MKRKLLSVLFIFTLLCSLTACSEPLPDKERILYDMVEANTVEALLKDNDYYAAKEDLFFENGTTFSVVRFAGKDQFVTEDSTGSVTYLKGDELFGFDADLGQIWYDMYIGNDPAAHVESLKSISFFFYSPDEVVLDIERSDDLLLITTRAPMEEIDKETLPTLGWVLPDDPHYEAQYQVNAKTLEIISLDMFLVVDEGTLPALSHYEKVFTDAAYEIPKEVTDVVYGEPNRTLNVVVNPGTDEEQTFTKEASESLTIRISADEAVIPYANEECTVPYTDLEPSGPELTLYVKTK